MKKIVFALVLIFSLSAKAENICYNQAMSENDGCDVYVITD